MTSSPAATAIDLRRVNRLCRRLALAVPLVCVDVSVLYAQQTAAPAPPACRAPEYRQFDFWIGRWTVRAPDGRTAGTNNIEAILDGCALAESWTGQGVGRGTSLTFYDVRRRAWHQVWIDNRGEALHLHGGLRDRSIVLEGETPADSGRTTRQRISWTPLERGEVRQLWQTSRDNGSTWSTVFDGRYVRAVPPPVD